MKKGALDDSYVTGQELAVWKLRALGYTFKQIGDTLGISPRTVDNHAQVLYRKLKVQCIADLTRMAVERSVIDIKIQNPLTSVVVRQGELRYLL